MRVFCRLDEPGNRKFLVSVNFSCVTTALTNLCSRKLSTYFCHVWKPVDQCLIWAKPTDLFCFKLRLGLKWVLDQARFCSILFVLLLVSSQHGEAASTGKITLLKVMAKAQMGTLHCIDHIMPIDFVVGLTKLQPRRQQINLPAGDLGKRVYLFNSGLFYHTQALSI